jgi:hypothetical protein
MFAGPKQDLDAGVIGDRLYNSTKRQLGADCRHTRGQLRARTMEGSGPYQDRPSNVRLLLPW